MRAKKRKCSCSFSAIACRCCLPGILHFAFWWGISALLASSPGSVAAGVQTLFYGALAVHQAGQRGGKLLQVGSLHPCEYMSSEELAVSRQGKAAATKRKLPSSKQGWREVDWMTGRNGWKMSWEHLMLLLNHSPSYLKGHGVWEGCLRTSPFPFLEENQYRSSLEKAQEGGPRKLQANQSHLHAWNNPSWMSSLSKWKKRRLSGVFHQGKWAGLVDSEVDWELSAWWSSVLWWGRLEGFSKQRSHGSVLDPVLFTFINQWSEWRDRVYLQ